MQPHIYHHLLIKAQAIVYIVHHTYDYMQKPKKFCSMYSSLSCKVVFCTTENPLLAMVVRLPLVYIYLKLGRCLMLPCFMMKEQQCILSCKEFERNLVLGAK